jgi:hypothetical protein
MEVAGDAPPLLQRGMVAREAVHAARQGGIMRPLQPGAAGFDRLSGFGQGVLQHVRPRPGSCGRFRRVVPVHGLWIGSDA